MNFVASFQIKFYCCKASTHSLKDLDICSFHFRKWSKISKAQFFKCQIVHMMRSKISLDFENKNYLVLLKHAHKSVFNEMQNYKQGVIIFRTVFKAQCSLFLPVEW